MSAATDGTPKDPYLEILEAEDPYPLLHMLRQEDPVHFVAPLGFWFVTRYDDVKRLFNDPDNVTGDRRVWAAYVPHEEGTWLRWMADHSLMALSTEDHARIRRLVSVAFTPAVNQERHPQFLHRLQNRIDALYRGYAALGIGGGSGRIELGGSEDTLFEAFAQVVIVSRVGQVTGHQRLEAMARRQRFANSCAVRNRRFLGRDWR